MISFLEKNVSKVIAVDTEKACRELGSSKVVNMVLLGAATQTGLFSKDDLKQAIKMLVEPEFYQLNVKAVDYIK